jgi:hypothetical protein
MFPTVAARDAVLSLESSRWTGSRERPVVGRTGEAAPETGQRVSTPGDTEAEAADHAVVQVVSDVITGYELPADDAADVIRVLRAALHGFVLLEAGVALDSQPTSIAALIASLVPSNRCSPAGARNRHLGAEDDGQSHSRPLQRQKSRASSRVFSSLSEFGGFNTAVEEDDHPLNHRLTR